MDHKEEYHDPDYAGTSENVKEEPQSLTEDERIEKIRRIIRREFSNELEVRENEVMLIDQRMTTSRRVLHRLRYALVNTYYREQKLQLSAEQLRDELSAGRGECDRARNEMSSLLRSGQRRLHPSVRKLLGRRTADLSEIFRSRQPRSRPRPDYSAMLQIRNYTIAADSTKSLRPDRAPPAPSATPPQPPAPEKPKKLPRHLEPKVEKVLTLDEQTRNKVKHRYRIVIGNTSKYAPPASRADRSTHKWLLYVRDYQPPGAGPPGAGPPGAGPPGAGPPGAGSPGAGSPAPGEGIGAVVRSVTARLHHSYAPHHTVTLHKPPFHISRRGWGEFTARVELHFALPDLNPPATVSHTLKLDRNYTGLQTLGAETIVDVWLYSSPEMLKHAYVDDTDRPDERPDEQTDTQTPDTVVPKQEPAESTQDDSWMDFFSRDTTEMDVDDMIIKPVKVEPDPEPDPEPEPEMEVQTQIKEEPVDYEENLIRDLPSALPAQPTSPKKRIMKYMERSTGRIYYLELDRDLDLSTVREIVVNNTKATISPVKNGKTQKKRQVSLLKPEVKNSLRTEQLSACFRHIENDHCYLGAGWSCRGEGGPARGGGAQPGGAPQGDAELLALKTAINRLSDVRSAVCWLLRRLPLVDARAQDPDFLKCFPFVVDSEERYWKLDFAKRRNIEWSRAKLISRLLSDRPAAWRTKQVLAFARLHGFHPVRAAPAATSPHHDDHPCSQRGELYDSNIKQLYKSEDINSLSVFDSDSFKSEVTEIDLVDSDEEVDVVGSVPARGVRRVSEGGGGRTLAPDGEDRLRFLFLERVCADVGIELRNEDVGNGYSYSLVHLVLLSALRSFAEELLRASLAASRAGARPLPPLWQGWSSSRGVVRLEHVYQAAGGAPPPGGGGSEPGPGPSGASSGPGRSGSGRLQLLCARALAAVRKDTYAV